MTPPSLVRVAAGLLGCAALVAGCSYSSGPNAVSSSPHPSGSGSSFTPSGSTVPTDPVPTVSDSTTATSPKPTKTPPAAPGCAAASLQVRAIQGGATAGQEIAAISVTNISAKTCEVSGYPGVSLLLHGALIGQAAQRIGPAPTPVLLAPNAEAQATLSDDSSCQAAVSDTVRIYPPDQTSYVDRPLEMRGCTLYINAFTAAN